MTDETRVPREAAVQACAHWNGRTRTPAEPEAFEDEARRERRVPLRAWTALVVLATLYAQAPTLAHPHNDAADNDAGFERLGFSVTEGRQDPFWSGLLSNQGVFLAQALSPMSVEEALGLTRTQRIQVQRGLTAFGLDVGAADGIFGRRTRAGIAKWQSSRGEAATGYLEPGAVETLLKAGEAAPPKPQKMAGRKATAALSKALPKALSTVRSIKDAYSRALALIAIAEAQANAGDARGAAQTISDALSTARSIKDASYRAQALGYIAGAQAIAGDIQVALSTVRSIKDAHSRALALGYIAGVQASAGDIQIALSTARTIKRASLRARAFSAIAEAQANAGDTRGAAQTVSDALSAARSIGDAYSRVLALSAIARAQAGAGDTRGTAQTISEALSIARSIERAVPRVTALSAIAKAQAKAGDTRGAAQTISEALSTARSIGDAYSRAWARSDIAGAQASAGDIEIALSTARTIKRAFLRAKALRAIAEAQANAGDIQGSLSTARNIEDVSTYAWALRDITKAQLNGADDRSEPGGATKRAAPGSDPATPLTLYKNANNMTPKSISKRSVDSNGSTTRQEFWGAYVPGQTTPSTGRVIYPYDVFGISWNFSSPETALAAADKRCRERSAHNCGDDHSVTFSSSADDSGYHLKSRCITAWVWANPGLSGLNEASWTSDVELPEYFQTIQVAEKKTACNER